MDDIVEHNLELSARLFMAIRALEEIADNATTLDQALTWAEDALDIQEAMKEKSYGQKR